MPLVPRQLNSFLFLSSGILLNNLTEGVIYRADLFCNGKKFYGYLMHGTMESTHYEYYLDSFIHFPRTSLIITDVRAYA